MFFGENLQILRKRDNLSQEDLADKLQVSRQAVSKWESGTGFPETEKIIAICEIFKCSMDELVKGKISLDIKSEKEEYERIMNKQIYGAMFGVSIILLGVTIMMILMGLAPAGELEERYSMFGVISVLIAVAVAVPTFIITGNEAETFKKNNTKITNIYTDKELESIKRKTTIIKAIGIFIILVGTIIMFSTMALNIFGERTQLSVAWAFALYQTMLALRQEAHDRYVKQCGPISQSDMLGMDSYAWLNSPWPWEYRPRKER